MRQTERGLLLDVGDLETELRTVPDRGADLGLRVHQRRDHLTGAMIRLQQLARIAHDDADLADARGGDGLEAVVQDRLVRDGHQLLGPRVRDGTEPRAAAAREDECLQCLLLM